LSARENRFEIVSVIINSVTPNLQVIDMFSVNINVSLSLFGF